jgi:predicted phosphodiesterase
VRVAAIYDVHGNLPALEAVLADIDAEGVDAVMSGGDLVAGPFPADTLALLESRADVRFLRGNADRLVLEGVDEHEQDWTAARELLGERALETIRSWPLTVELEIEGLGRTLFCHAVPSADEPIFTRITPDDEVAQLIGDVAADLVVCGHTHAQFDRRLASGLRIVNAGSVGMPYQGRRGAFWALLGPEVELRRTEYDTEAAVAAICEATGPRHEQLAAWLLEPPDPEETAAYFESLRAKRDGA